MTQETVESPRLADFRRRTGGRPLGRKSADWAALVAGGLPLIEDIAGDPDHLRVTFVWRPGRRLSAPTIYTPVANILRGESRLQPLGRTGTWYRSFVLPRATRASYAFSPRPMPDPTTGGDWGGYFQSMLADPNNPSRLTMFKDPDDPKDVSVDVSEVALPGAPSYPWTSMGEPSRWKVETARLPSERLGGARRVWVFTPPDFTPHSVQYNVILGLDGLAYQSIVPAPRIVEYLVGMRRIGPSVVVLVESGSGMREHDLLHNPAFGRFLVDEVVPWLRQRHHLSLRPHQTVIFGSSLGGLAAAYAAYQSPEVFGNVLAQSGAFSWSAAGEMRGSPELMVEYATAARKPIKFYLDAGTLETVVFPGFQASLLAGVRHLRDVLVAKGYTVNYAEFAGGHDYACWSGTLADGLTYLLGK